MLLTDLNSDVWVGVFIFSDLLKDDVIVIEVRKSGGAIVDELFCKRHGLDKHLLEEAAFEGLGLGDLGGDAFDLAVDGGKEIGDLGLFVRCWESDVVELNIACNLRLGRAGN